MYLSKFFRITLVLLLPLYLYAQSSLVLTPHEKEWIKQNQIINITGDPNWLPFEAFNDSGKYIGIVSDILNIVEHKTGIKFNIVTTSSWEESISLLQNSTVDMLSETVDSPLNKNFLFTDSFLSNPIIVIMRDGSPYVNRLSKLQNKKIALIKHYGYTQKIKRAYPKHHFYEVKEIEDALLGVAEGKYDAILTTMAFGSYHIRNMQINNINVVGRTEFSTELGFAISSDKAILVEILNKVFQTVDESSKQAILAKWVTQDYVEKTDYVLIGQIVFIFFLIMFVTLAWSMRLKKEIARRIIAEQENKKMLLQQAKHAALGEMMDSVAHQWKQPLNAISMLNELLVMDYKSDDLSDKYLKEYQEEMDTQVQHLLTTLAEFRTFFRPDKKAELFNLLESINAVLLLLKDELLKNAIEVEIVCDKKIELSAIKNEFKHILLNILNNAKDAFIENKISHRKISIEAEESPATLLIKISDNAGGIPETILPNIFEANVTSKEDGKGTGVGLYMSKQIADKIPAELSAQNREGGALFILSIESDFK